MKTKFQVTGMTCAVCASRVERAALSIPGVSQAQVNLLQNLLLLTHEDPSVIPEVETAIASIGYQTHLLPSPTEIHQSTRQIAQAEQQTNTPTDWIQEEQAHRLRILCLSLIFTLPLFYLSMGEMMSWPLPRFFLGAANSGVFALTQFLLLIPILFLNRNYFTNGFRALFQRDPNMETLIAVGAGASTLYGLVSLLRIVWSLGNQDFNLAASLNQELYFEGAGTILTLITFGKWMEARAKGKTSEAVAQLLSLTPPLANVLRDGEERQVPVESLVHEELVLIRNGERVPVDGEIVEGSLTLDESALTGESLPAEKGIGDSVYGGTLNQAGFAKIRVTQVAGETLLARIVSLVEEATLSRAPIAKLADRVSGIFVPIVLILSAITLVIWLLTGHPLGWSLSFSVAVLVISCPCALGLATPTAILVGTGRAAKMGILFKSAEALEQLQSVQTILLDKTGTVTEGKPVLTRWIAAEGVSEDELFSIAAAVESGSEHPFAQALVDHKTRQGGTRLSAQDFLSIPGVGVTAQIGDKRCGVGNTRLLKEFGIPLTEKNDPPLQSPSSTSTEQMDQAEPNPSFPSPLAGETPLWAVVENQVLGCYYFKDPVKAGSREAVEALHALGLEVAMITGDRAETAESIRKAVGIDQVWAEVFPQEKEEKVRSLQAQGKRVAMIGDGINDAPALARADVGLAIGAGTDIALEAADVVLMRSDLLDSVRAYEISQATLRNIKQNLFWAFLYNTLGIPVAAGLLFPSFGLRLNPMLAALAMSLSSVFVVTNALRLRWFTPRRASVLPPTAPPAPEGTLFEQKGNQTMEILKISGMSCAHCVAHVTRALEAIPGVDQVEVDLESGTARIEGTALSRLVLQKAIEAAGYTVEA